MILSGNFCSIHIGITRRNSLNASSRLSLQDVQSVVLTTSKCTFLLKLINMKRLSSVRHCSLNSKAKRWRQNLILLFVSLKQPNSAYILFYPGMRLYLWNECYTVCVSLISQTECLICSAAAAVGHSLQLWGSQMRRQIKSHKSLTSNQPAGPCSTSNLTYLVNVQLCVSQTQTQI